MNKLCEYHVPKLARSEITGADGGAVEIESNITINLVRPNAG
jgi:hypothetical protein